MLKDFLAILGVILVLIGIYFIHWQSCLIVAGLLLTTYCLITVWQEAKEIKIQKEEKDDYR